MGWKNVNQDKLQDNMCQAESLNRTQKLVHRDRLNYKHSRVHCAVGNWNVDMLFVLFQEFYLYRVGVQSILSM